MSAEVRTLVTKRFVEERRRNFCKDDITMTGFVKEYLTIATKRSGKIQEEILREYGLSLINYVMNNLELDKDTMDSCKVMHKAIIAAKEPLPSGA